MTHLNVSLILQNFSQCRLKKQQRSDLQLSEKLANHVCPPLKLPGPSQSTIVLRCLRGALNWVPIMPREFCIMLENFR